MFIQWSCSLNEDKSDLTKYRERIIVLPNKNIVKKNEEYTARIKLLGEDSLFVGEVYITDIDNRISEYQLEHIDGYSIFRAIESKPGVKRWNAIYRIRSRGNSPQIDIPFSFEYKVQ